MKTKNTHLKQCIMIQTKNNSTDRIISFKNINDKTSIQIIYNYSPVLYWGWGTGWRGCGRGGSVVAGRRAQGDGQELV